MDESEVISLALLGIVALGVIVAAGVFSRKLGVAAPLILIVVGVGLSYVPGAPVVIPNEVILIGLLPPILYASAITVPVIDLRRNLGTISALSVALVVVSAVLTGLLLFALFPDLELAAAIAIGAVISPTDAVAATAVAKKLGLPSRLITILEGESLVNDATALVLLRSAVAATAATASFWEVLGDFAFAVAVAVLVGLAIGFLAVRLRARLADPVLDTAVSFIVPFAAFLPAEFLGASGVLAVVVAGLYSGHNAATAFTAQSRITERTNWRTLQFVLENGVFLLMGIQVSYLVRQTEEFDLSAHVAVLIGLLVVLVVLGIRFAFVGPLILLLRRRDSLNVQRMSLVEQGMAAFRARVSDERWAGDERVRRHSERVEQRVRRRRADVDQLKTEGLDWRGGVVLGWAGMRGVVTLAAAQSLPEETPYRPQLILIAFTVAVVTLLAQGGTLPWVIRLTGIRGSDAAADRRSLAALFDELAEAGVVVLDEPRDAAIEDAVVQRVRADTLSSARAARERAAAEGDAPSPEASYRALRREVLEAQRAALLEARSAGTYPSRILARAQSMLDLEETRLEQLEGGGS
ncbi:MAG TPA: cation:proton antiporter [Rhodoglobus sp.]|nr:cation:proton antiporter [Rhodoglobus sp.]